MHKVVKHISKGLFVLVVIILTALIIKQTFHEEQTTIAKDVKVYEVSQEEIISSGQEIVIKSFQRIDDLRWIDNHQLYIEGKMGEEEGSFLFDTLDQELKKDQPMKAETIDYGEYKFIQEIPDIGALCTKANSIGILKDGTFDIIAENASYEGQLKYKLSDDLSKLLYYHHDKDTIVSYAFADDFYRTINITMDANLLDQFKEVIQVSPLGGYVSVEHRSDILEDTYFSIYGADSGRLYADEVYGTYLSWSSDDKYVCYYYTKESEALIKPMAGMHITSRRIGYYDVAEKAIKYMDSSQTEKQLISKIYWNGNTASVLAGRLEEGYQVESIISYDFTTGKFQQIDVEMPLISATSQIELLNQEDTFVLLVESDQDHLIIRILKDSHEVLVNDKLLAFDTDKASDLYYYTAQGKFITFDSEKLTISSDHSENYVMLDDSAFKAMPTQDMAHIAVWLTNRSVVKILKSN